MTTPVERSSRHTLLAGLPDGYGAKSTAEAAAAPARQPEAMVRTLARDQGTETARWADIEKTLDTEVYSCDPHSPRQRPANEQNNGLLRRRQPKSTDPHIPAARPPTIEDNLNTMPRKLHHRQSAQTIHTALNSNHRQSLPPRGLGQGARARCCHTPTLSEPGD